MAIRWGRILAIFVATFLLLMTLGSWLSYSDCKHPEKAEDPEPGCPALAPDQRTVAVWMTVASGIATLGLVFSWAWFRHGNWILAGSGIASAIAQVIAFTTTNYRFSTAGALMFGTVWLLELAVIGLVIASDVAWSRSQLPGNWGPASRP